MITKMLNVMVLFIMLFLCVGCGQQETFFSVCMTAERNGYLKQPAPNTCPFAHDADVPVDQRWGW